MLIVASVGLPVNIVMFFILHDSKHHHGMSGHKHPP
jgi:Co/Zn/Cd efflux system component